MRVDLAESLLGSLGILFSNNIDIKVVINSLLDDFGDNDIVFFLFFGLGNGRELCMTSVYHILEFFFFEHSLHKVCLLKPVSKAVELFSFAFAVVILSSHCDGSDIRE